MRWAQGAETFSFMTTKATPGDNRPPAVETSGLTKVFGSGETEVRALSDVDFLVSPGEFVAIMGPSGSGKSTLLHILGALESPTAGSVAVGGVRYEGLADSELTRIRREHIGFVFQFFNLLAALTAEENVTLPAVIAGDRRPEIQQRGAHLLERIGLDRRAHHLPSELSGGEQQRVSIARALLLEPELVLADEPTGNLDSRAGRSVLDLLRQVNREEGQTVVMVTHDPSAAARADRIVYLRDGEIAGEITGGSTERAAEYLAQLQAGGEVDEERRPEPAATPA
jgi:putative ABC transport system ATP-binding protein